MPVSSEECTLIKSGQNIGLWTAITSVPSYDRYLEQVGLPKLARQTCLKVLCITFLPFSSCSLKQITFRLKESLCISIEISKRDQSSITY